MKRILFSLFMISSATVVAQTPVNTCTAINTSGSYQIMNPISGDNCLTVTGGSVTVSCAPGATIGNIATQQSLPAVNITGNTNVTLSGCTVQVTGTSQSFIKSPISAINSVLTLTGDTVIGGETYLQNSVTTINGGTYEALQVNGGSATFNNNPSFTATPGRGYITHVVWVNNGGVLFAHSGTLTGNWSGTTTEAVAVANGDGIDDTLLLDNVGYGGIVQNLSFTAAFDVGIENLGLVAGWTISDNQFSHMGFGCVGGWYASSWDGNTLQRNTCRVSANAVSSSPRLFSWAYYQWGGAFDPIIYFRNNNITDNVWLPDSTVKAGYALWLDPTFATAYGSTLVASGNTFAGNTLRPSTSPVAVHMLPVSAIVDRGSNVGTAVTWPDQQAPYPLQFGSIASLGQISAGELRK